MFNTGQGVYKNQIVSFKTLIKCVWFYLLQLLKTLRDTKVDIKGTMLEFDSNGNPNVGYNLIELMWKNSTLEFVEVGSFNKILKINVSLFKWHTETSEVIKELQIIVD